jgi:hypothetical protein
VTTETPTVLHFLETGLTLHVSRVESRVMRRGDILELTPQLLELNRPRTGGPSALELSEIEQRKRWGKVHFRQGEPPAELSEPVAGSFEEDDARVVALRAASAITDPDEQRAALARVREKYGVASQNRSRTLAEYRR